MGWLSDTWDKISEGAQNLVSDPGDWANNVFEDAWDTAMLPNNTVSHLVDKAGGNKIASFMRAPTWDEWQRPGQTFSGKIQSFNKLLPTDTLRQWAPTLETAIIGAYNPYLGAAFKTAYDAGEMQQNQKGMDWGEVGKDAAINFGTAAVSNWAKNKLATDAATTKTKGALDAFNDGSSSTLAANTVPATEAAVSSVSPSSAAIHKFASSGGIMDSLRTGATKAAPGMANQALTTTLAPEGTEPVSGMYEGAPVDFGQGSGSEYGDVFKAFGTPGMLYQDENGNWKVDEEEAQRGRQAIGANRWLRESGVRDTSLPAGQWRAAENTPYNKQLQDIDASTQQYFTDFDKELQAAGKTKALMQANPWMTEDMVMQFANDPSLLPESMRGFFTDYKPIFY